MIFQSTANGIVVSWSQATGMVPGANNDKIMKTIAEIVADNKERILCAGTAQELRQIGIELGFDNRSAFPRYKAALLKVCGIDYNEVRAIRREQAEMATAATLEQSAAGYPLHIVYCDAAIRTDAIGAKVAVIVQLEDGTEVLRRTAVNGNCHTINGDYDQFAAECFGVLKAVETAKDVGFKRIEIRNDRISSFSASTKRDYDGSKYLFVARRISEENGILVTFRHVSGEDNIADSLSRSSESCRTKEEEEAYQLRQQIAANNRARIAEQKHAETQSAAPVTAVSEVLNRYGNVDIMHGVRDGLVHLNSRAVRELYLALGGKSEAKAENWMRKTGIEFAVALVGFSGRVPQFDGFVVGKKDAPKIEAVLTAHRTAAVEFKPVEAPVKVATLVPANDDLDERGIAARDVIDGDRLTILNFKGTRRHTVSLSAFLAIPGTKIERRNAAWMMGEPLTLLAGSAVGWYRPEAARDSSLVANTTRPRSLCDSRLNNVQVPHAGGELKP